MFARMPETGAKRERSAWGTMASVAMHVGVILLLVAGKHSASAATWRPANVQRDTIVYVAPRDVEGDQSTRDGGAAHGPRPDTRVLLPRTDLDRTIGRFDGPSIPREAIPFPSADTGLANEIARGSGNGGDGEPAAGAIFDSRTVDRDVGVARERAPRYPDALRAAGVSGVVTVRFVVDTAGRIEPGSLHVIESPNEQFTAAVLAALRDTRFSPGESRGRPVRVLVQRSFRFELEGAR